MRTDTTVMRGIAMNRASPRFLEKKENKSLHWCKPN